MKVKPGDIVRVEFWDHSSFTGAEEHQPMKFEVIGRLAHETDIHYIVGTWLYPSQPQDHNAEFFSIIKGAVINIRRLR